LIGKRRPRPTAGDYLEIASFEFLGLHGNGKLGSYFLAEVESEISGRLTKKKT
jgi:hypothetical protein